MCSTAAKALLAFNQAIRHDESEANVVKAFQDAMIPGMNFDLSAKDAFRVIIDGMKLEATFDESTRATFFNYYRGVTPIIEKFAAVTKLDVSEFYVQLKRFGPKTTERATAFFVSVEEGKNTPEATANAFVDMVYGCHNETTLDETFDDYIELAKSKVSEDKEVNAYLLDVLKMEERVFIALKDICGKDVSAYYSLFALYEGK